MPFEDYERAAPVRWPVRRHELLCYLHELASPTLQQERWIEMKPGTPGEMYGFDFVIHFFFDDTDLGENPELTLGDILIDGHETAAVRRVAEALDQVLHDVGLNQDDADYVSSPTWSKVIETATEAYQLMRPRLQAEGDTLLPPDLPRG